MRRLQRCCIGSKHFTERQVGRWSGKHVSLLLSLSRVFPSTDGEESNKMSIDRSTFGTKESLDLALCPSLSRTWMLWPTRPDTWKASAGPAQIAFAAVAKAIAQFEPVTVGVPPGKEESARMLLEGAGMNIVVIEQDDAWIRDTGPMFVVNGTLCSGKSESASTRRNIRGVDWSFNAWGGEMGGCFSSWNKDEAIASTVLRLVGAERYKANMILEVTL